MKMEAVTTEKKGNRNIIFILMVIIIALIAFVGYLVFTGNQSPDTTTTDNSGEEYTFMLEEFVVNLRWEGNVRNYIKINVALMYTHKEELEIIQSHVNKVRDVIITSLRGKSTEEMLNNENMLHIKEEMVGSLNDALNQEIVKDVYFTDMVVQ